MSALLMRLGAHVPAHGIVGVSGTARPENSTSVGFELRNLTYVNFSRSGWTEEWFSEYQKRDCFSADPTKKALVQGHNFQRWSDAFATAGTEQEKRFVQYARSWGLDDGVSVFSHAARQGSVYIFSFLGGELGGVERHEIMLRYLAPYLREAMRATESENSSPARDASQLSPREVEVLCWAMAGKTNWEIAAILAIGERTVKFHVQNVKTKLQAASRAHAVAIALRQGLIPY